MRWNLILSSACTVFIHAAAWASTHHPPHPPTTHLVWSCDKHAYVGESNTTLSIYEIYKAHIYLLILEIRQA